MLGVGRAPLARDEIYYLKNLLNFLTVIWHSGTNGGIHRHTVFCFLSPLVNWLAIEPRDSRPLHWLLDSVFTAFTAFQGLQAKAIAVEDGKFGSWDTEALWKLATNWGRYDIVVAC